MWGWGTCTPCLSRLCLHDTGMHAPQVPVEEAQKQTGTPYCLREAGCSCRTLMRAARTWCWHPWQLLPLWDPSLSTGSCPLISKHCHSSAISTKSSLEPSPSSLPCLLCPLFIFKPISAHFSPASLLRCDKTALPRSAPCGSVQWTLPDSTCLSLR